MIKSLFLLIYLANMMLVSCVDGKYQTKHKVDSAGLSVQTIPLKNIIQPDFNCINRPTLDPLNLPGDSPLQNQTSFNCFAWQVFIALNWIALDDGAGVPDTTITAQQFGNPGDLRPLVWQTFKSYLEVFLDKGKDPKPWGDSEPLPSSCIDIVDGISSKAQLRAFRKVSKFPTLFDTPEDMKQAYPFKAPNWLADKKGNLVWYEMLMNKDEFGYIYTNKFYRADAQLDSVREGSHINLPQGIYGGKTGSIEIKSGWLKIDSPEDWPKHKITQAYLYNSTTKKCSVSYFALVGLHILHKTVSEPQWVWATFEHVDNAPDIQDTDNAVGYTFYDSNCQEMDIPPSCVGGSRNQKTSCVPNKSPAYYIKDPICSPYAIQVAREIPISSSANNPVVQLNLAVQDMFRKKNKNSIWQNYQLIDVLWSQSPVNPNGPGTTPPMVPLSMSGITPDPKTHPVSNTTSETYIQGTTCIQCHRDATIAIDTTGYASDFSFLLGKAKSPE